MISINIGDIGKSYGWLVVLIAGIIGGIWISHHLHNLIEDQVTKGIQEISTKIDSVNASLNTKIDSVNANLNTRIDSVNARIDKHEIILNNIRDRVASIEGRLERNSPGTQASVAHSPVTGSTL